MDFLFVIKNNFDIKGPFLAGWKYGDTFDVNLSPENIVSPPFGGKLRTFVILF